MQPRPVVRAQEVVIGQAQPHRRLIWAVPPELLLQVVENSSMYGSPFSRSVAMTAPQVCHNKVILLMLQIADLDVGSRAVPYGVAFAAAPALRAGEGGYTPPLAIRAEVAAADRVAKLELFHAVRTCRPDTGIVRGADRIVAAKYKGRAVPTAATQGRGIGAREANDAPLRAALGTGPLPLARLG